MARFLVFILFISATAVFAQPTSEEQFLRRSLELEEAEKYEQALDLWETALTELQAPSLAIGREYIRLATEQELSSRYETASALYRWGLTAKEITSNKKALKEELAMLEPLMEEGEYRRLKEHLEKVDPLLYEKIAAFWQTLDPTPATAYNERLIEHWERIAWAREHFTINDNTSIGTDDRGIEWVRYGEPDRKYDGILQISSGRIASVIDNLDPYLVEPQKKALINSTLKLHDYSRYEIWIYEELNQAMEYNLVLIFGDRPSGGFGRLETVDDFIPSRAFSTSGRHESTFRGGGVFSNRNNSSSGGGGKSRPSMTPGMVMQWLYYEQLAAKDFYFSYVYDKMANAWDGDARQGENLEFHRNAGPILEEQTRMATIVNLNKAPEELSTYEKEFPAIPLEIHRYRLLDEENRPVVATFLESLPQQVFVEDLAANEERMQAAGGDSLTVAELFGQYELLHGLQLLGPGGQVLANQRVPADMLLDSTGTEPSSSVFVVPHVSGGEHVIYAELHNRHPASQPKISSPFPNSLRGLGRLKQEPPDPLDNDPEKLQMGDLILGYHRQEEVQENNLFPFIVTNDRRIPADQNLMVHVETYHLQEGPGGLARFRLEYEILPVNFLGWTKERQKEFALTLNLQTPGDRYAEDLEIKTRELEPGRYVLRMEATEPETGRQVRRDIKFEVVE